MTDNWEERKKWLWARRKEGLDATCNPRTEEAITYYFQHRDDLRIPALLARFGIGAIDLGQWLYQIECYFGETGELPFAPELNVDIDAFSQFKDAADKYEIYLILCLDEPIKSPQYRDSALSG